MLKKHSKKDHPYTKFFTGSLKTLNHPSIRDDLIKFYNKYYSANLMKLIVYSDEKIETLESWVKEFFIHIKNKNLPSPNKDNAIPYGKEELTKMFYISPVKNENHLVLIFYLENH